ncbi:MAG: collagen-like protein, partial [Victivallales bacterium]|nr:collagen-like protein [Victivallales bacterium]
MQDINTYIRRHGIKGAIVDAYNMSSSNTPSITIGMAVLLRLRIFEQDADETSPAGAFSTIASWNFAIDRDYNRTTEVLLRANTDISVSEDGIIQIPLPDTNTQALVTALGTAESATFIAELAGYENGNTAPALVLQFPIIVYNRVDPEPGAETTSVTPATLTLAQITALLGAQLEFQYSADGENWHSTQTTADTYFRARNAAVQGADYSLPVALPKGADGHTVDPDLVAPIAERPASPEGDFCFIASDEGKVYWYKSGAWSAGAPLTTVAGPQGLQGIQGQQGPQGDAATIEIGTVTSVPYGTRPQVTNSGTKTEAILNFQLPQGPQGLQGPQGPQGLQGLTGPAGDGLKIDATGTLANRHEYDNASAKFRYMATDFYVDTVTTAAGTYQRDYASDTQSAYAWTNHAASPETIYTSEQLPELGSTAGGTVNGSNVTSTIVNVGEKYQLYYQ